MRHRGLSLSLPLQCSVDQLHALETLKVAEHAHLQSPNRFVHMKTTLTWIKLVRSQAPTQTYVGLSLYGHPGSR